MGFVADFLKNTTVEKFRKSANICQSYERMYLNVCMNECTIFF